MHLTIGIWRICMDNLVIKLASTFTMGLLFGALLAASSVQDTWRLDAAQTDCARFNPEHGQFEWLGERDE